MIAAGYMARRVAARPDWLDGAGQVVDVYSVSGCISEFFADYIGDWKHNDYWLFDAPEIIREVAAAHEVDLSDTRLFFYEVHEFEYDADARSWRQFAPEDSFVTEVVTPADKTLEGYDVVSFFAQTSPECSPLSCNGLAKEIATNQHCLLASLEEARALLEGGKFENCEPGPYRIFAVYSVPWP